MSFLTKMPEGRRFKKGHLNPNWRPLGSERLSSSGYIQVKVGPNQWRPKHLVIWEEENGPLLKQYALRFRDGNRKNVVLENLEMVWQKDYERRDENGFWWVNIPNTRRWQLKHVRMWETYNGPLPRGYKLCFVDGDRDNISLKNLIKVPRKEKWSISDVAAVARQLDSPEIPFGVEFLNRLKSSLRKEVKL